MDLSFLGDPSDPPAPDKKRDAKVTIDLSFLKDESLTSASNNERNDQALGHFGSVTLRVRNLGSMNTYSLDANVQAGSLVSLFFPKGGHVDFDDCQLSAGLVGVCEDRDGGAWDIQGEYPQEAEAQ